jgi:uncharacterized membrane protein YhaH (DUF805 family)
MLNLMFEPLRKYADFTGRARRSEYWLFWLFSMAIEFLMVLLFGWRSGFPSTIEVLLYCIVGLGLFVPSLAVAFRRLHDTDRSALWLLIAFLPIIGAIVLLVFTLLEGTHGPNRYGPDPKGPDDGSAFA